MQEAVVDDLSRLVVEARRILPLLASCPDKAHLGLAEELERWIDAASDLLEGGDYSRYKVVARGLRRAVRAARALPPCMDGLIREARRLEGRLLEYYLCANDPVKRLVAGLTLESIKLSIEAGDTRRLAAAINMAKKVLEDEVYC